MAYPLRSENVHNVFGYRPEELTSREMTYARLIHQDDLDTYLAEVRNCTGNPRQDIIDHSPYRIITATMQADGSPNIRISNAMSTKTSCSFKGLSRTSPNGKNWRTSSFSRKNSPP